MIPKLQVGDWVVDVRTRKVSQFQAFTPSGKALVVTCQGQIKTWPPGACIRIAGRYELDDLQAMAIEDELDTADFERSLRRDYLTATGQGIPYQSKRSLLEQDLAHTLREMEVAA